MSSPTETSIAAAPPPAVASRIAVRRRGFGLGCDVNQGLVEVPYCLGSATPEAVGLGAWMRQRAQVQLAPKRFAKTDEKVDFSIVDRTRYLSLPRTHIPQDYSANDSAGMHCRAWTYGGELWRWLLPRLHSPARNFEIAVIAIGSGVFWGAPQPRVRRASSEPNGTTRSAVDFSGDKSWLRLRVRVTFDVTSLLKEREGERLRSTLMRKAELKVRKMRSGNKTLHGVWRQCKALQAHAKICLGRVEMCCHHPDGT